MANVCINFDIPHLDPTSENLARVKDTLSFTDLDLVTEQPTTNKQIPG